jgi:hypothetical protein
MFAIEQGLSRTGVGCVHPISFLHCIIGVAFCSAVFVYYIGVSQLLSPNGDFCSFLHHTKEVIFMSWASMNLLLIAQVLTIDD